MNCSRLKALRACRKIGLVCVAMLATWAPCSAQTGAGFAQDDQFRRPVDEPRHEIARDGILAQLTNSHSVQDTGRMVAEQPAVIRSPTRSIPLNTIREGGDSHSQYDLPGRPMPASQPLSNSERYSIPAMDEVQKTDYVSPNANVRPASFADQLEPMRIEPAWSESSPAVVDESATESGPSFIEREALNSESAENPTLKLASKLSINLILVLSIATAVVMTIRQWQQSKGNGAKRKQDDLESLKVIQVVPLSRGASLHLVQGGASQFVVAIDSTGIKSVNVVSPSFDHELAKADLQSIAVAGSGNEFSTESEAKVLSRAQRNRKIDSSASVELEPTPDMDERLVEMLLGKQAA